MSEWEEDKNKYIYTMYVSIYEKERTTTTKAPTTSTLTRQEQQVRGDCPTFLLYFDRFDVVTKLLLGCCTNTHLHLEHFYEIGG